MRFKMIVMSIKNSKEVSIIDTEEENAQLFCCKCQAEDLFFCKTMKTKANFKLPTV